MVAYRDLSDLTLLGVETLDARLGAVSATLAKLDSFDGITSWWSISIRVVGGRSADLSDEIGGAGYRIYASNAGSSFMSGSANCSLLGGTGHDILTGMGGDDVLAGDLENDVLVRGESADNLSGGDGIDTARYVGSVAATVALDGSLIASVSAMGDIFAAIENLSG